MKKETYDELKEKVKDMREGLEYFERSVKSRNKKRIRNSLGHFLNLIFKSYKELTGKGTTEAIQDFTKILWWFKINKDEKKGKRKLMKVEEFYNSWAKSYDTHDNLLIYLEEKFSNSFFGNVKGKKILDYGCGTGRYSILFAKKGANVTAIDFSEKMLSEAKKKSKKERLRIDFYKRDITKYLPREKFDLITSMLVLDHIDDLNNVIEIIDKASKIGTKIVISNVHPDSLRKNIYLETGTKKATLLHDKDTSQWHHSIEEYVELFKKRGFVLTKIKDLVFEKKYWNIKRFKSSLGAKGESIGIIMCFEKIK